MSRHMICNFLYHTQPRSSQTSEVLFALKPPLVILALLAFILSSVFPAPSFAETLIDNFNDQIFGRTNINLDPGTVNSLARDAGGILGGERDSIFSADADNSPDGQLFTLTSVALINQALLITRTAPDNFLTTGIGDGGFMSFVYDGNDNDVNTNAFGLAVDLSDGGVNNTLRLRLSTSTAVNTMDLVIYSDDANYSEIKALVLPQTDNAYREMDLLFSEFSLGDGADAGADFSSVSAISLQLTAVKALSGDELEVPIFALIPFTFGYRLGLDNFSAQSQLSDITTATLANDVNGDGDFDSSAADVDTDTILYTVTLTNTDDILNADANNVLYSANFATNATLVPGSVNTSQGTVTLGNGGFDSSVAIDLGNIVDADVVTITYQAKIDSGLQNQAQVSYLHQGTISSDSWTSAYDTAGTTIDFNQFDIELILTAIPAVNDADLDGFAGAGEQASYQLTVTNIGPNPTNNIALSLAAIFNGVFSEDSLTGDGVGDLACISASQTTNILEQSFYSFGVLAAAEIVSLTFDLLIDDPFPHGVFSSIDTEVALSWSCNNFLLGSGLASQDVDAFPENSEAYVDADADGLPDFCNGIGGSCGELSLDTKLNDTDNDDQINDLDTDDDGDSVPDVSDAFSLYPQASVDSDNDFMPDNCVALGGGASEDCGPYLLEDLDDDNDSVDDINDAFNPGLSPNFYSLADSVSASVDTDGDGLPDDWNTGCDLSCQTASSLLLDGDNDGDGDLNEDDAFPLNKDISDDTDGDGLPDDFNLPEGANLGCDAACQILSDIVLDDDDDNDGVDDLNDAYPKDCYFSVDTDGDGDPDAENDPLDIACLGVSSEVVDIDDDNDLVEDSLDDFPLQFAASIDNDADGFPDEWNSACDISCQDGSGLTLDAFINDSNNDGIENDSNDSDGDGILNDDDLEPFRDNNPPSITAPPNKSVVATGTLTEVSLGSAIAEDFLDGIIGATVNDEGPYPVGLHILIWSAMDAAGNIANDTQILSVVEKEEDIQAEEGGSSDSGAFVWRELMLISFLLMFSRRKGTLLVQV